MFLGLCILFFLDVCTFLIVFSGRLKFVDLKINKAVSKDLNEENHGQSKNEGFEAFERVILFLLATFLKEIFSTDQPCYCLASLCCKIFSMSVMT